MSLRTVLRRFTKSIHQAFINNRRERASYLKNLYSEVGGNQAQGWYLDIGARDGINSLAFGQDFAEIVMLDIQMSQESREVVENYPFCHYVLGDAENLPFKDCSFELVTMISTLEHLQDAKRGINEAARVTKGGGQLVIQVPNRHFILDLHTGLPNPFLFCPSFLRRAILSKLGYPRWVDDVHKAPSEKRLTGWTKEYMQLVGQEKVIYPEVLIPKGIRLLYKLLKRSKLLNLMPLGYMYVYQKVS
jgi:ubiquinone/menaquinone biosynthesis C-methylase UbiE